MYSGEKQSQEECLSKFLKVFRKQAMYWAVFWVERTISAKGLRPRWAACVRVYIITVDS